MLEDLESGEVRFRRDANAATMTNSATQDAGQSAGRAWEINMSRAASRVLKS